MQSLERKKLTPAQNHILQIVMKNSPIRPDDLLAHPDVHIGRIMVQRHLKNLCQLGFLEKEGQVPRVFYSAVKGSYLEKKSFFHRLLTAAMQASLVTKQIYQNTKST
ncbi:MAG: hypothetical protein AB8C84_12740 [Oligoflexales bacterium]